MRLLHVPGRYLSWHPADCCHVLGLRGRAFVASVRSCQHYFCARVISFQASTVCSTGIYFRPQTLHPLSPPPPPHSALSLILTTVNRTFRWNIVVGNGQGGGDNRQGWAVPRAGGIQESHQERRGAGEITCGCLASVEHCCMHKAARKADAAADWHEHVRRARAASRGGAAAHIAR